MHVYLAGPVPPPAAERIGKAGFHIVSCTKEHGPSRPELLKALAWADGIITLLSSRMDREAIAAAPRLKVISNYAVGTDNIDVDCATEHGIAVTNTPGVLTQATAELALALLFAASRRIPEGERFVRADRFIGWSPNLFLGVGVIGKTLGIAGFGRIGRALAAKAKGLGLQILYYDCEECSPVNNPAGALGVGKAELLARSDFLSLHLPLTPKTRHFLRYDDLCAMKETAILINTARGPVVCETDLARALREGRIRGAGLDVYEEEPKVHPDLLGLENVVLLPHVGSATVETRGEMAELASENLIAVLEGRRPPHPVNPEVLEGRPASG